jgi:hypothetical protein
MVGGRSLAGRKLLVFLLHNITNSSNHKVPFSTGCDSFSLGVLDVLCSQ